MIKKVTQLIILTLIVSVTQNSLASYQCSNELESQLSGLPSWLLDSRVVEKDEVPLSCIENSMSVFFEWTTSVREERANDGKREIGHYAYCKDGASEPIRKHIPPCPTSNYLNVVSNSYNSVLKCLDFSPKEMFAITAVESGFQTNTLSIAGIDIGIGQLTPVAVEDVNPEWQNYLKRITESSNPHCGLIKGIVAQFKTAQDDLVCSLTALPENPLKNMVYLAFLNFKNKEYLDVVFDSSGTVGKIETLIQRKLETNEINKIKEILITLSYNAGAVGAVDAINAFIDQKIEPLRKMEDEFDAMKLEAVLYYLDQQSAQFDGDQSEVDKLKNQRKTLILKREILKSKMDSFTIPISDFAITEDPNSFGKFLVESKTSFYLNVLKNRIVFVEDMIGQKGDCAPKDYLEKIQ